jgi:hypothetical protein
MRTEDKQVTINTSNYQLLSLVSWGGLRLSPLVTSATIWPVIPSPDDG